MATIEMDSVECVSSSDGIEDEDSSHHSLKNSSKPHNILLSGIGPTSVHELLECPFCTNSMYPPIHQVINLYIELLKEMEKREPQKFLKRGWWEMAMVSKTRNILEGLVIEGSFKWLTKTQSPFNDKIEEMRNSPSAGKN